MKKAYVLLLFFLLAWISGVSLIIFGNETTFAIAWIIQSQGAFASGATLLIILILKLFKESKRRKFILFMSLIFYFFYPGMKWLVYLINSFGFDVVLPNKLTDMGWAGLVEFLLMNGFYTLITVILAVGFAFFVKKFADLFPESVTK